jgi:hypothetical protein
VIPWQAIAAAAGAIAAYFVADKALEATTGRGLTDRLYAWWAGLRDRIVAWKIANPHLQTARILAKVVEIGDKAIVRIKQTIQLKVFAQPTIGKNVEVTEETIDLEQLEAQFPGAVPGQTLELTGNV